LGKHFNVFLNKVARYGTFVLRNFILKMSREISWRRKCPEIVSKRLSMVPNSQFFILQEPGPTAFILKSNDSENQPFAVKKFKVTLGSIQSCNCSTFMNKRELCIHILWVMTKIFQVPHDSEMIYQQSLIEREVQELIQRRAAKAKAKALESLAILSNSETADEKPDKKGLDPRPISSTDVCPICQELLLSPSAPLTHCRLSCGNSIHIRCMKVLMDHQIGSLGLQNVKCPLCRNDFGSFEGLQIEFTEILKTEVQNQKAIQRKARHFGCSCHHCKTTPIVGTCHNCISCPTIYLCDSCFVQGSHQEHAFQHKLYRSGKWIPSSRNVSPILQNREITDADYEMLLVLDSGPVQQGSIPLHVINSFPVSKVSKDNCSKCKVCANPVQRGDMVRKIPCGHSFHKDCIDRWLLKQRTTCPTCGLAAYSSINEDQNLVTAQSYIIEKEKPKKVKKAIVVAETNAIEIVGCRSLCSPSSMIKEMKSLTTVKKSIRPKDTPSIRPPRTIDDLFISSHTQSQSQATLLNFQSLPVTPKKKLLQKSRLVSTDSMDSTTNNSLLDFQSLTLNGSSIGFKSY
jgi:E3 ubiquitin-protein ligase ZSWIM2